MRFIFSGMVGLLTFFWLFAIFEAQSFGADRSEFLSASPWLAFTAAAAFWRLTNPNPWR